MFSSPHLFGFAAKRKVLPGDHWQYAERWTLNSLLFLGIGITFVIAVLGIQWPKNNDLPVFLQLIGGLGLLLMMIGILFVGKRRIVTLTRQVVLFQRYWFMLRTDHRSYPLISARLVIFSVVAKSGRLGTWAGSSIRIDTPRDRFCLAALKDPEKVRAIGRDISSHIGITLVEGPPEYWS